jgi:hypothetical protein
MCGNVVYRQFSQKMPAPPPATHCRSTFCADVLFCQGAPPLVVRAPVHRRCGRRAGASPGAPPRRPCRAPPRPRASPCAVATGAVLTGCPCFPVPAHPFAPAAGSRPTVPSQAPEPPAFRPSDTPRQRPTVTMAVRAAAAGADGLHAGACSGGRSVRAPTRPWRRRDDTASLAQARRRSRASSPPPPPPPPPPPAPAPHSH